VSVITALMPRMSRAAATGDLAEVRRDLAQGMRLVSAILVPAGIMLALLGPRIAQLLLGYGNTSDPAARLVGQVLQGFSVGIVAYSLSYALLRGFYAVEDTRTPALVNVLTQAVNVGAGYALYRALPPERAVAGLALGYAISAITSTVVLWLLLRPRLGGLDTFLTVRTLVRLALAGVASAIAGAGAVVALGRVTGPGKAGALLVVVVVSLLVAGVFVVAARRLRVAEMADAVSIVARRLHLPA